MKKKRSMLLLELLLSMALLALFFFPLLKEYYHLYRYQNEKIRAAEMYLFLKEKLFETSINIFRSESFLEDLLIHPIEKSAESFAGTIKISLIFTENKKNNKEREVALVLLKAEHTPFFYQEKNVSTVITHFIERNSGTTP